MRVVLVSHYFPEHRGGVEIVAGRLVGELCNEHGMQLTWFSSDCDASPPAHPALRVEPVACLNGMERWTSLPYPLWSPRGLSRLDKAIRSADVVHLHDFIYMGSLCAYALARRHRKPVVITQHLGATPYDKRALRVTLRLVNRILGARILAGADQVVFISDAARAHFSAFTHFRREPVHWPNGVDAAVFFPVGPSDRESIRSSFGFERDRPLLLFVGRFVEHKGLELLHEVCRLTPSCSWAFVGWGTIDPERWNLPNVQVFRGLSGATLAPLYQAADLLVLPSREGGFPLVVQEAMACGTPALISEKTAAGSPNSRPFLETEPLWHSGAAQRWASRIGALIKSPDTLRDRRSGIAAFARNEWSWSACAGKYRTLFERLAGGGTRSPPVRQ